MNFNFLATCTEMEKLKCYCFEAEEFALSYPDISITASRKAAEYIVKMQIQMKFSAMPSPLPVPDCNRRMESALMRSCSGIARRRFPDWQIPMKPTALSGNSYGTLHSELKRKHHTSITAAKQRLLPGDSSNGNVTLEKS